MKNFYVNNKNMFYYALFLGVTTILVTAIAFIGYSITNPIIEQNRIDTINNNIALLFDPEDGYLPNQDLDSNSKYAVKNYKQIEDIYEVLDESGNVYAVIYNVFAQGRNDDVYALVAIDPYSDTIIGVVYYRHGETPNIGEKYTRDEEVIKLIGQSITEGVEVDFIAGASVTWGAIDTIFNEVQNHYENEEVHING